jgi:hypothetical protein
MQKALDLLEKNVQFIALGLGALFLLLMAYSYLLTPPVTVKVGAKELQAGEVDEQVKKVSVAEINRVIQPQPRVQFDVSDPVATLLTPTFNPRVDLAPLGPGPVTPVPAPGAVVATGEQPSLPAVAAARPSANLVGRSLVGIPDVTPKPAAPAVPVRGLAAPGAAAEIKWKDVDFVTQLFHVTMTDLAQAFAAAKIPDEIAFTRLLAVEVVRQEMLPNGQWGLEKVIEPLPIEGLEQKKLPAENATKEAMYEYRDWATVNAAAIIQPPFPKQHLTPGVTQWQWPGLANNPAAQPGIGPGIGAGPGAGKALAVAGTESGFRPAEAEDFDISAHDITVEPAKIYRYSVRYAILNPLWGHAVGKPADQLRFALWSPLSDWSQPVSIPGRVRFWLARTDIRNKVAEFDLFTWTAAGGGWGVNRVTASAGDPIGPSPYVVVDIRGDQRASHVLIADAKGATYRRDVKTDEADPDYLRIKGEVVPASRVDPRE